MYKWNIKARTWRKLSNKETIESRTVLLLILSAPTQEAQIYNGQVGEKHSLERMLVIRYPPSPSHHRVFWEININFIPISHEFY